MCVCVCVCVCVVRRIAQAHMIKVIAHTVRLVNSRATTIIKTSGVLEHPKMASEP